jgi:hypothetical protein
MAARSSGQDHRGVGVSEGEQVLRMLAHHPSTARFIATKLARRFVADEPPAAVIDAAAKTFSRRAATLAKCCARFSCRRNSDHQRRSARRSRNHSKSWSVRSAPSKPKPRVLSRTGTGTLLLNNQRGILAGMGSDSINYEAPDGNPDVSAA